MHLSKGEPVTYLQEVNGVMVPYEPGSDFKDWVDVEAEKPKFRYVFLI